MPSERRNSGLETKERLTKPHGVKRAYEEAVRPPLPPGEESMLDLFRESVKARFPDFVPRNNIDLITIAGLEYDGPTDQESMYTHIDAVNVWHAFGQPEHSVEDDDGHLDITIGRMRATDALGAKPRPRQKVWVRAMPSWPKYSIRLWVSSSDMRLFGMDFVESSTGTPINLSHRFTVYGMNLLGHYIPIAPFHTLGEMLMPRTQPIGPAEELYNIREEQDILIEDMLQPMPSKAVQSQEEGSEVVQKTLLKFKVPRHPADPPQPPGIKYDEIHWSLDD